MDGFRGPRPEGSAREGWREAAGGGAAGAGIRRGPSVRPLAPTPAQAPQLEVLRSRLVAY